MRSRPKRADYEKTIAELEVEMDRRVWDYERYKYEWDRTTDNLADKKETSRIVNGLKIAKESFEIVAGILKDIAFMKNQTDPTETEGVIGPFPVAELHGDVTAFMQWMTVIQAWGKFLIAHGFEVGIDARELQQEQWDVDLERLLRGYEFDEHLQWLPQETQAKLKEQYVKQAELFEQVEALSQSYQRVQKLLAEGERCSSNAARSAPASAQRIQTSR